MILLGTFLTKICLASEEGTQTSRYLTIKNKPKLEQVDLISQTIQVSFPTNILTVGDAIKYLLRFSGYSLVSEARMNQALSITLQKPLPLVDRTLGPISLHDALKTMTGVGFDLMLDPIHREVDFKLKKSYEIYMRRGHV